MNYSIFYGQTLRSTTLFYVLQICSVDSPQVVVGALNFAVLYTYSYCIRSSHIIAIASNTAEPKNPYRSNLISDDCSMCSRITVIKIIGFRPRHHSTARQRCWVGKYSQFCKSYAIALQLQRTSPKIIYMWFLMVLFVETRQ